MSFRKEYYKLFRSLLRKFFTYTKDYRLDYKSEEKLSGKNILVIGIYLTDHDNEASLISSYYSQSDFHTVNQFWYAIGNKQVPESMKDITLGHSQEKIPKFQLLNKILAKIDYKNYDFIIFTDDDIFVRKNFIDTYTYLVNKYQFKLAQPARTRHSYYDHKICLQAGNRTIARTTNFVEIGPIFSISKDVFDNFLPFPEDSPMGYGLDYIWPVISREQKFNMGIIDATPVDHSYREQGKTYSSNNHLEQMQMYLNNKEHTLYEDKLVYKIFK